MSATKPALPTQDAVYSNLNHELDEAVVAELEADSDFYAQHSAWDFCGYVWFDGRWHEEAWVHGERVATYDGDTVMAVISDANYHHGAH